jgi:3'-phosphoadenosine 5'-phosphosulfate (PAPS) 3'-phosphatase
MEWDNAAADAVVRAAGGKLTTLDKKELIYNKQRSAQSIFPCP